MSNYERDKAAAEAVHQRLTMEWKAVAVQAMAPLKPHNPETLWQRLRRKFMNGTDNVVPDRMK